MFKALQVALVRGVLRPTHTRVSTEVWSRLGAGWKEQRWEPDFPSIDEFVEGAQFGFDQVRRGLVEPVPDVSHLAPLVSRDLFRCIVTDRDLREQRCIDALQSVCAITDELREVSGEDLTARVKKDLPTTKFPEPCDESTEVFVTGIALLAAPPDSVFGQLPSEPVYEEDDTETDSEDEDPVLAKAFQTAERADLLYRSRSHSSKPLATEKSMASFTNSRPFSATGDKEDETDVESPKSLALLTYTPDYLAGYGWDSDDGVWPDMFLEVQTNIIAEYTIPTASLGNPFDHEGAPIALVPHSDRLDDLMKSDVLSVVYVASGWKHGALNELHEYPYRSGQHQDVLTLTWSMPLWTGPKGTGRIGDVKLMNASGVGSSTKPYYVVDMQGINAARMSNDLD
eukprot:m.146446 g.146446  ORF g.146446 m.146446 type:complete len:398 (-) comp23110_c0_seq1:178-1371(-)